jgi:hypothetical protein
MLFVMSLTQNLYEVHLNKGFTELVDCGIEYPLENVAGIFCYCISRPLCLADL